MEFTKKEDLIFRLGRVNGMIAFCEDTNTHFALQNERKDLEKQLKYIDTPLYEVINGDERK